MTDAEYREREMREQLERGPHPDEHFFRLQVQGNGASRWVNITPKQLGRIAAILGEEKDD